MISFIPIKSLFSGRCKKYMKYAELNCNFIVGAGTIILPRIGSCQSKVYVFLEENSTKSFNDLTSNTFSWWLIIKMSCNANHISCSLVSQFQYVDKKHSANFIAILILHFSEMFQNFETKLDFAILHETIHRSQSCIADVVCFKYFMQQLKAPLSSCKLVLKNGHFSWNLFCSLIRSCIA